MRRSRWMALRRKRYGSGQLPRGAFIQEPAMKRLVCLATILAAGCSTASKDIASLYVSPMQYEPYSCEQLAAENARVESRARQVAGRLDEAAQNDKALAVSAIVFWPTLFALGGTKQQEAEYARLKGEHDAVQQAGIQKRCPQMLAPSQQLTSTPQPAVATSASQ